MSCVHHRGLDPAPDFGGVRTRDPSAYAPALPCPWIVLPSGAHIKKQPEASAAAAPLSAAPPAGLLALAVAATARARPCALKDRAGQQTQQLPSAEPQAVMPPQLLRPQLALACPVASMLWPMIFPLTKPLALRLAMSEGTWPVFMALLTSATAGLCEKAVDL